MIEKVSKLNKTLIHICPECDDEFRTEKRLVDHLNDIHEYGWSYKEYHQLCGNMNQEWREGLNEDVSTREDEKEC